MMSTSKRRPDQAVRETVRGAGQITFPIGLLDPEVAEEFVNVQRQMRSRSRRLIGRSESWSHDLDLTDGDLDAAWDGSDVDEYGLDRSAPTPDQNAVDELGKQVGLTFRDNELVDAPGKVGLRDHDRWELTPASSEDYGERQSDAPATRGTSAARS